MMCGPHGAEATQLLLIQRSVQTCQGLAAGLMLWLLMLQLRPCEVPGCVADVCHSAVQIVMAHPVSVIMFWPSALNTHSSRLPVFGVQTALAG